MHILITGAAGFLASKLIAELAAKQTVCHAEPITEFSLVDIGEFQRDTGDIPCRYYFGGIPSVLAEQAEGSESKKCVYDLVFHLAAVTSSQAESEFDLGFEVNVTQTVALLNMLRQQEKLARLVMTSSIAVFGVVASDPVPELAAVIPNSTYGMEKAICELVIHDFARRNFVDGRVIRLPTIVVRPGKPNAAASSFLSSIIREPLAGEEAECYAPENLPVWLSSPNKAVYNIIHAASLSPEQWQYGRMLSMPGLSVTVGEMIATLAKIKGEGTARRITIVKKPKVERIVASWPGKLHTDYAKGMGFITNSSFAQIIEEYCRLL